MMKRPLVKFVLGILLISLIFGMTGCGWGEQPGETLAEGHRRHIRKYRLESQSLARDLDLIFLTDGPSKLSERRIP